MLLTVQLMRRISCFQSKRKVVAGKGAELLITACAYCKDQFQKVMPVKDKTRIKDLTELVDERT